jgi:Mannosyltransferase putative
VEKLILKCGLSPGDIVMLTAAVRDLHRCYPQRFLTDVRTLCPDLWTHNPHLTPLQETDADVRILECHYPLIDRCNTLPVHCLQGFIDFLNEQLGLQVKLSACKGDIHLSPEERAWFSQVHELTGEDTPFWIVTAGGKYDVTVKWWAPERYQQVVNHFRRKILFVQVGQRGHHHPRLDGVLDLRGRTTLRMLVRLIHHAQGVLSPITCLMHMAAAVPIRAGRPNVRSCVVVAGGREPVHWEEYPGHQFIHTIGALSCCTPTGCWRDRVKPLHDGDSRDHSERLCRNVAGELPRCMDLITAQDVIGRIERYFEGGMASYVSREQWAAARRGIRRSQSNPFDQLALTSANCRIACEQFIREIPKCSRPYVGRGIVIAAGGCRYFTNAWVTIHLLRQLGCTLPIQVWHLGREEFDDTMAGLLRPLQVECIDARRLRQVIPCRILHGWELKCYALLHSPFTEVLYLDADNVPVRNPEYLFHSAEYAETGAVFWPDLGRLEKTAQVWDLLGLRRPSTPEFESGQMLINKRRCWSALRLAMWMNENSDYFYRYLHGDKETFHLAFRKLDQPFSLISAPVHPLPGTMCQHDFEGRRLFQHRNTDKWNLFANNPKVADFWLEDDCRRYLHQLQQQWSGQIGAKKYAARSGKKSPGRRPPSILCGMISCPARNTLREETLRRLSETDWKGHRIRVEMDDGTGEVPQERQTRTALRLLQRFVSEDAEDYLLFLEDDLGFNRHLRRNLETWPLLRSRAITLASLYNPGIAEEACDLRNRAYLVRPERIYGSQAFLLSRRAAEFLIKEWHTVEGMQDIRISRLAGRLRKPIWYHSPSLVQHLGQASTWGGAFHSAMDFAADWKSE